MATESYDFLSHAFFYFIELRFESSVHKAFWTPFTLVFNAETGSPRTFVNGVFSQCGLTMSHFLVHLMTRSSETLTC